MEEKPIGVQGIDIEIQLVFKPEHIQLVLPYFAKAGLQNSTIDEMIDSYIDSGEIVPYEKWFLEYGQQILNPLMNQNLGREIDYPTFNRMLNHVLKEIIQSDSLLSMIRKANK